MTVEKLEPTLQVCTFATNSAQCGSASGDPLHVSTICGLMLEKAASLAKKYPDTKVRVTGNQNSTEDPLLGAERARAVAQRLSQDFGVDESHIIVGVGNSGNRTVEVRVE